MKLSLSAPKPCHAARLLAFASLLLVPAAFAHAQTANTPASGKPATASQDQYSGVSHPPADDTIVANDDSTPPPSTQPQNKPSPGVPVTAAAPAQPQEAAAPQVRTQPVTNPDYGIVTSTDDPAQNAGLNSSADTGYSAKLVSRPTNPDYGIVDMVPSPANELAEGTDIHVRLLDALSTTRTQDGQEFRAQVAQDVYKDGRVVIPTGSELRGRVVQVSQGHRLGSRATLRLRPDDILLPDGTAYHLYAQAVGSSQPGTRTDDEGGIQSKPHVAKDLTEYGAGAGGGAIVGSVFGGPVGAGAGAIVGASLVTTHMLLQKPAEETIERGSEIVFSLTEPMALLPTKN